MLEFTVRIDWLLLGLVGTLAVVLASLYAVALSTAFGREVCRRRTYWTVIGGHLLMALAMSFVSAPMAGLWLLWSVLCGTPLVVRSLVQEWREEKERAAAADAALKRVLGDLDSLGWRRGDAAGGDRGGGDGYGVSGAGVAGSG